MEQPKIRRKIVRKYQDKRSKEDVMDYMQREVYPGLDKSFQKLIQEIMETNEVRRHKARVKKAKYIKRLNQKKKKIDIDQEEKFKEEQNQSAVSFSDVDSLKDEGSRIQKDKDLQKSPTLQNYEDEVVDEEEEYIETDKELQDIWVDLPNPGNSRENRYFARELPKFISSHFIPGINSNGNIYSEEKDFLSLNEKNLMNKEIPDFDPILYLGETLKKYALERKQ